MSKILVIDDDPDFLYAVRMVLEGEAFEVDTATTPEEGISKVKSTEPDLVVLDVLMPTGYEGFEVARAIREEHNLIKLPILMLTNVHNVKEVPYRFAPNEDYLPVDIFLDKPIEPDVLVDTVREMLGERREEPEHPL
ncbi:MAG: response regulator [Anaerolineae bacterium]|jgi:CheY-like chemotaxis protein